MVERPPFKPGDRVRHHVYGLATVKAIETVEAFGTLVTLRSDRLGEQTVEYHTDAFTVVQHCGCDGGNNQIGIDFGKGGEGFLAWERARASLSLIPRRTPL